jgi:hypothetical protein
MKSVWPGLREVGALDMGQREADMLLIRRCHPSIKSCWSVATMIPGGPARTGPGAVETQVRTGVERRHQRCRRRRHEIVPDGTAMRSRLLLAPPRPER